MIPAVYKFSVLYSRPYCSVLIRGSGDRWHRLVNEQFLSRRRCNLRTQLRLKTLVAGFGQNTGLSLFSWESLIVMACQNRSLWILSIHNDLSSLLDQLASVGYNPILIPIPCRRVVDFNKSRHEIRNCWSVCLRETSGWWACKILETNDPGWDYCRTSPSATH